MNLIRAGMQLFGLDDTRATLSKDAPQLSSNVKLFVQNNLLMYYILINTWLLLIKEYSEYGWCRVADAIRRKGLIPVIKEAQDSSDELIRSNPISSGLFRSICHDASFLILKGRPQGDKNIGQDVLATQLGLLRYPKRLSPIGNDLIQQKSIQDFIAVENRSKIIQRSEPSRFLMSFIKKESEAYMPWTEIIANIDQCLNDHACQFTSGVGFDSGRSLGSKLLQVAKNYPEYFIEPFGLKYTGAFIDPEPIVRWGHDEDLEMRLVKVAAVPKSYKASRIIAMEDTTRQSIARAVASILDRYLPPSAPIHDQEVNQTLAEYGSSTGKLATLDLSHASDCITKSLACLIFPTAFTDRIMPLLGTHTSISGKVRLMQQMSTAGNSLTFILETMIFDIICRASRAILETFGVETIHRAKGLVIPSVYGDDIVVDNSAAPITIEVLTALGFIVNEAKSFFDGSYRESCGSEYWMGRDVSSIYFPRFPIEGSITDDKLMIINKYHHDSYLDIDIDTMSSLVSLQHRLYGYSYGAARFVYEIVRAADKRMTTSTMGSLNGDLWEYEDTYIKEKGMPFFEDGKLIYKKQVKLQSGETFDLTRKLKLRPVTRYALKDGKQPSGFAVRLFNAYRYREFLERGPRFSDPLLETLGISDAPITLEQAFGKPDIIWVPSEPID